ncbi:universal stress protein [Amycolatopsis circi]|uniref:universal stress protein n=1 Tax=Amycolatopsis circi TaxID=871959 RepID=UPI0013BEA640|nr:universal stress protein [Amycolatopsis circi]
MDRLETAGEDLRQAVRDDLAEVEPRARMTCETSPAGPEFALREASAKARSLVLGAPTGSRSGLLAGSPDLNLAAHAHCPVVVVRGRTRADGPVVVGVDGSPLSDAAIGCAFEEATLHAWLDADRTRLFGDCDFPDAAREAEHRLLAQRLAGYGSLYPDVRVEQIVEPDRPREWSAQASLVVNPTSASVVRTADFCPQWTCRRRCGRQLQAVGPQRATAQASTSPPEFVAKCTSAGASRPRPT